MMTGTHWTALEEAVLKDWWGGGRSVRSMARDLDRSEAAVLSKAYSLGLGPRRKGRSNKLTIFVADDVRGRIDRGARERGMKPSVYARNLVEEGLRCSGS